MQNVLIAGIGSLGSQILHHLSHMDIQNIYIVDMDVVEETNLCRQSIYSYEDISVPKVHAAARYVSDHRKTRSIDLRNDGGGDGKYIYPIMGRVQELSTELLGEMDVAVMSLDNTQSRLDINVRLAKMHRPERPMIILEVATEGFLGQYRIIILGLTPCYACYMMDTESKTYPLCSVKEIPILPEHCITFVSEVEWAKERDYEIDLSNFEHMQWIHDRAVDRASKNHLEPFDIKTTISVLGGVISASPPVNSLVSAMAVKYLVKYVNSNPQTRLAMLAKSNHYTLSCDFSIYINSVHLDKNEICFNCSNINTNPYPTYIYISKSATLQELLDKIKQSMDVDPQDLVDAKTRGVVYMANPALRLIYETYLQQTLAELNVGEDLLVGNQKIKLT